MKEYNGMERINQIDSDMFHRYTKSIIENVEFINRISISESTDIKQQLSRLGGYSFTIKNTGRFILRTTISVYKDKEPFFLMMVKRRFSLTEYADCYGNERLVLNRINYNESVIGFIELLDDVTNKIKKIIGKMGPNK